MIWANYDVAGSSQTSEQVDTSTNYLARCCSSSWGAAHRLPEGADCGTHGDAGHQHDGYCDADRTWFLTGEKIDAPEGSAAERAATMRYDLSMIQYFELFGHGDGILPSTSKTPPRDRPNLAPGTTKIK